MDIFNLKKHFSKLTLLFSLLLAATLSFPIKIHNGVIIVFLISSVLAINWADFKRENPLKAPLPLLIVLQFLVIVTSLLYTPNLQEGINQLERAIYPLLILILIYQIKKSDTAQRTILIAFSCGCIILTLYGFGAAYDALGSADFKIMLINGHRDFTTFIVIQPLYLSVYFTLLFFFFLEEFRTRRCEQKTGVKLAWATLIVFAFAMVLFLRSKTGLIVLPALLVIYLVIVLKKRGWMVAFILVIVAFLTFLLDSNPAMNFLNGYGRTVSSAFDERTSIWRGAIEGIKVSPWIGAGTGGDQELINSGYAKIGYQEGIDSSFNAHNQYLQFMARNGVIELTCFLILLAYSFWKSQQRSNYTFLMFNMLVSFVMLTESFLSVQKGIAFFYFFLVTFHFLPDEKSNKPDSV